MSWVGSAAAGMSAVSAVIAARVAGLSIVESRRLFKLRNGPDVILYMERNSRYADAAELVIENIGDGIAFDVRSSVWSELTYDDPYERTVRSRVA